ncbi:unnamed protein product, partial [Phaeothamnion confervicola]
TLPSVAAADAQERPSFTSGKRRRVFAAALSTAASVAFAGAVAVALHAQRPAGGAASSTAAADLASNGAADVGAFANLSVFHIADVHVEPFFDPSEVNPLTSVCRRAACAQLPASACVADFAHSATYDFMPLIGCDAPMTLLESALDHMYSIDPSPDAIIFAGDSVAHYTDDTAVADAVQRAILSRMAARFPGTPVVFAVGNNDFVPDGVVSQGELNRLWKLLSAAGSTTLLAVGGGSSSSSDDGGGRQSGGSGNGGGGGVRRQLAGSVNAFSGRILHHHKSGKKSAKKDKKEAEKSEKEAQKEKKTAAKTAAEAAAAAVEEAAAEDAAAAAASGTGTAGGALTREAGAAAAAEAAAGALETETAELAASRSTFLAGGYYAHHDAFKRLRMLALNSMLWSPSYVNGQGGSVADGQMAWFSDQLAQAAAAGERVIIVGHIPPGMFLRKTDWTPSYLTAYLSICEEHASTIMAQLFGHHSKEMIRSLSPDVAVLVTVGMTPAGGHGVKTAYGKYREAVNPGFSHLVFSHGRLAQLTAHHADLSSFMLLGADAGLGAGGGVFGGGNSSAKGSDNGISGGAADPAAALAADWMPAGGGGTALAALRRAWRIMYNFTEEYEVPDVTPASIRLVQERITAESKFASRYSALMRGYYANDVQPVCDAGTLDLA